MEAARAACTPDVVFWHSFDRVALTFETAAQGWAPLFQNFCERAFTDVRRFEIPGGFVQQYLMVARTTAGASLAWPICAVVQTRDGLVSRFDEYIDRAGHFATAGADPTTPGLAPIAAGRPG